VPDGAGGQGDAGRGACPALWTGRLRAGWSVHSGVRAHRQASDAEPYYGIRIDLDPKEVAAFILEMQLPVPAERDEAPVVTVEPAGDALLEAFLRLLRLLDRPRDLAVLGRLLKQEIMYHLVTAPAASP